MHALFTSAIIAVRSARPRDSPHRRPERALTAFDMSEFQTPGPGSPIAAASDGAQGGGADRGSLRYGSAAMAEPGARVQYVYVVRTR